MPTLYQELLYKLNNAKTIQKQSLGLDNTEYNVGLYNGIEYSLSLLEDREPNFKHYSVPLAPGEQSPIEKFWGMEAHSLDKEED